MVIYMHVNVNILHCKENLQEIFTKINKHFYFKTVPCLYWGNFLECFVLAHCKSNCDAKKWIGPFGIFVEHLFLLPVNFLKTKPKTRWLVHSAA